MTTKPKTALKIIDNNLDQAEAEFTEAAQVSLPMVQRLAAHRDHIDLAVKELESERFELISRRDSFRRQAEAVEHGYSMHIEDVEATLKLYEGGLNGLPAPVGT